MTASHTGVKTGYVPVNSSVIQVGRYPVTCRDRNHLAQCRHQDTVNSNNFS